MSTTTLQAYVMRVACRGSATQRVHFVPTVKKSFFLCSGMGWKEGGRTPIWFIIQSWPEDLNLGRRKEVRGMEMSLWFGVTRAWEIAMYTSCWKRCVCQLQSHTVMPPAILPAFHYHSSVHWQNVTDSLTATNKKNTHCTIYLMGT